MNSIFLAISAFLASLFPSTSANTSTSAKFDLLINGQDNPSAIVMLDDVKPGDNREVPKEIFIKGKNQVRLYLHLFDIKSSQGFATEPENAAEAGTPKFDMENYTTYDLRLGNEILIDYADKVSLPEAVSCWIPLGIFDPNTKYLLYQSFHFDPTVGNWAQGDRTEFSEEFIAVDVKNTTPPQTSSGRIWNPTLKKCVPGGTPTKSPTPSKSPTPTKTPTPTKKPTYTPKPKPSCYPVPTITISNNGAGSQNTVIYNYGCRTEIRQGNTTTIINDINSSSSTGDNSVTP